MQAYSNPKRASDPHALPDVEVWYVDQSGEQCPLCSFKMSEGSGGYVAGMHSAQEHNGWYWQACFPGCLPDGEPSGPFATEAEALADAQEGSEDSE